MGWWWHRYYATGTAPVVNTIAPFRKMSTEATVINDRLSIIANYERLVQRPAIAPNNISARGVRRAAIRPMSIWFSDIATAASPQHQTLMQAERHKSASTKRAEKQQLLRSVDLLTVIPIRTGNPGPFFQSRDFWTVKHQSRD